MNKTRGFLYVVFGEEYVKAFRASYKYLRRVTDLPVCVITNWMDLKLDRQDDVIFYKDLSQYQNRLMRTRAIDYTPFDQTLMLDADTAPVSDKINHLFDGLDTHDMGFLKVKEYTTKIPKLYAFVMNKCKVDAPLEVHSGGILLFNKTPICMEFFERWHGFWEECGSGRDMAPLNCTIKVMRDRLRYYLVEHCIDREIGPDTIIFHAWANHDPTILPSFEKFKPFDAQWPDAFRPIDVELGQIPPDPYQNVSIQK